MWKKIVNICETFSPRSAMRHQSNLTSTPLKKGSVYILNNPFPKEITVLILSHLSNFQLFSFKGTCKQWFHCVKQIIESRISQSLLEKYFIKEKAWKSYSLALQKGMPLFEKYRELSYSSFPIKEFEGNPTSIKSSENQIIIGSSSRFLVWNKEKLTFVNPPHSNAQKICDVLSNGYSYFTVHEKETVLVNKYKDETILLWENPSPPLCAIYQDECFFTVYQNGTLHSWDRKIHRSITRASEQPSAEMLCFHLSNEYFAYAYQKEGKRIVIRVQMLQNYNFKKRFTVKSSPITSIAISGTSIYLGTKKGALHIWDFAKNYCRKISGNKDSPVVFIRCSNEHIFYGEANGKIHQIELATKSSLPKRETVFLVRDKNDVVIGGFFNGDHLNQAQLEAKKALFSADRESAVTTIEVVDLLTGETFSTISTNNKDITSIEFKDQYLLALTKDGVIHRWDFSFQKPMKV